MTSVQLHARNWRYRASDAAGLVTRGEVSALDAEQARASVRRLNLMPLEIELIAQGRKQKAPISSAQLGLGLRILADLFDAGLSLTRALKSFEGLAPREWKAAIPSMRASLKEGRSFAQALEDAPIAVPPLVYGMLAAGEAGSGLGPSVRSAAEIMEGNAATHAAVRAALAYPIILATAGISSISLLIGVVLPRFAEILADIGQELPPATRMLIHASLMARSAFVPALVTCALLVAAWYVWLQTEHGLEAWHRMLLRTPGIAAIRMSHASARASTTLAALLTNGVPLPLALTHAARATGDSEIAVRITHARTLISRGHSLEYATRNAHALTDTTSKLIGAGEHTSRLPAMLQHAGRIEQELADRTIRKWIKLLEPALVMLFALIVGLVAAALLQAVYSVKPNA